MSEPQRPYGLWSSPLSPRALAGRIRLNDVQWDGETLIWLEGRAGQNVLVASAPGDAPRELTDGAPPVRGGVGYGGGEFTVANGVIYFASGARLYRLPLAGGRPKALTPPFGGAASPRLSPDGGWLIYVYTLEGRDGLALVDSEGVNWPSKFASGDDFYMQPVWHPQGTHLAYVAWNFPQMPWDGTELRLATLAYDDAGRPSPVTTQTIAGGRDSAALQPEFSPDGRWLSYISDESGWMQIMLYDVATRATRAVTSVEAEHGIPHWIQGVRSYGWTHDSRSLLYIRNERGFFSLWRCDVESGVTHAIALEDYTYLNQIAVARHAVALFASSSVLPERVISVPLDDLSLPSQVARPDRQPPSTQVLVEVERRPTVHRRTASETIPPSRLSAAQPVEWAGHDGETVYGLYYPPAGEGAGLPPLVVMPHSGPTSQSRAVYTPDVQFFATRGFAVLQVNYRGSTGYGRAYQDRLRGNWGIYDVEDSASGAAWLCDQGKADRDKRVIMGGSAGGYTVLQSLVLKPGFYQAGICAYGVSDHFSLYLDSEFKFESRYSEMLMGVLPEDAARYRERSPLFHADRIVDPVIIFQGDDDTVVPKFQSDAIVAALRERGVPHEYHVFAGEGHGWRKPETIEAYYTAILAFLKRYVLYR